MHTKYYAHKKVGVFKKKFLKRSKKEFFLKIGS